MWQYTYAALTLCLSLAVSFTLWLGFFLLGNQYLAIDPYLQINSMLTYRATVGVGIVLAGCCLGPLALGWSVVLTAQRIGKGVGRGLGGVLLALPFSLALALCVYAWVVLIVPGETYHRGTVTNNQPDTLKQFLGGLMFSTFTPAVLFTLHTLVVRVGVGSGTPLLLVPTLVSGTPGALTPGGPGGVKEGALGWLSLLLLSMAVTFATSIFTPVWNFSSTSYFTSQAFDSLGNSWSLLDPALKFILGPPPADPTAWMQPIVYVKLYSDVVIFFTVIVGVAMVGVVGQHWAPLRRALHKRYRLTAGGWLPDSLNPFPMGASLGECGLLIALLGLYIYWVIYWTFLYTRITNEAANLGDTHPKLHVAARVLGHLTTLTMSFLAFPVARNSVWESVFGVPFDRAIKVHRWLGTLCWVLVTLHMVLWQVKWLMEGNLLSNVFTVSHLEITPCKNFGAQCFQGPDGTAYAQSDGLPSPFTSILCPCVYFNSSLFPGTPSVLPGDHADNFTIVLVEAAWLLLTLALIVAVWWRRKHYEAFQYTHYAVLVFFAAGLVHAWSHWYYTAGGLILLALDKVTRGILSARRVRVIGLEAAQPGVTRLTLAPPVGFTKAGGLFAGQYVWLNIPAVSLLEWHPFTISSSPGAARSGGAYVVEDEEEEEEEGGEGRVTFHIKDMGKGTWSGRLGEYARGLKERERGGGEEEEELQNMAVSLDGPYGRLHLEDSHTLVLFAGGIGITPFHSLLGDLCGRVVKGGDLGGISRVHLVWTYREAALLEVFADTLGGLLQHPEVFSLSLYCTEGVSKGGKKEGGDSSSNLGTSLGDREEEVMEGLLSLNSSSGGGKGKGGGSYQDDTASNLGWSEASHCTALAALVKTGRPNVDKVLRGVVEENSGVGEGVLAMVCGPEALNLSVSNSAFKHGVGFHTEHFTF